MGAALKTMGCICWTNETHLVPYVPGQNTVFAREPTPVVVDTTSAVETDKPSAKPRIMMDDSEALDDGDWDGRVKCTPVQDEGFICMGTKAPICPGPVAKASSGPITLAVLEGTWLGSSGAQISVLGTQVSMNGMELKQHRVQLHDDGTVSSVGTLWQLYGWSKDGGIEWRASSTKENMECARAEVWTRKEAAVAGGWSEKMQLLGYAGSAASPLERGVEGCCPGTLGAEMPAGFNSKKDAEDIELLTALILQWREPEVTKVRPCQVVPDFTNRAQTGLGVELVHFIAMQIKKKGFQKREGNQGHDIPVVVREPPSSETHDEALTVWKERVAEEEGFPPVRVDASVELFSSLGNGHFFQALNLYDCGFSAINDSNFKFTVGSDANLRDAISNGVPSIVLKHATPKPVRAKIAEFLNSKRDFHWSLAEDGSVDASQMHSREDDKVSQFEWLSKGMDAHQVNCLVRTHLGIRDSKRVEG